MATGTLSPTPYQTVLDTSGNPVSGGLIWTYLAGTSTPVATYTDVGLTVANTNPIVADSAGRFVAYLTPGVSYKYIYETAATPPAHGAVIKTVDNILAVQIPGTAPDVTGTAGENLSANQLVFLSDGTNSKTAGRWYKADAGADYSSLRSTLGFTIAAITTGNTGQIRTLGALDGFSSLTVGAVYYVGTAGAITTTPSTRWRTVGQAMSSTVLNIQLGEENVYLAINAKWYGAIGNDSDNDTTALQNAINAAVAVNANGGALFIPQGVYKITSNLTIPGQIAIYGEGKNFTQIKAYGTVTRMLEFPHTGAGTDQQARCHIEKLALNGNSIAKTGIYATYVTHSTFRSLYINTMVSAANEAGLYIGGQVINTTGGWCNTYHDVEVSGNAGDGIVFVGACNNNTLVGCKVFSNDGVGLTIAGSNAITIVGTDFELNKKTAIFGTAGASNLDVTGCYFLSNSQTGVAFSTPASTTIKADIILNGSSATVMSSASGSNGVRVANCYAYPYNASADGFIAAFGYDSLAVESNSCDGPGGQTVPLVVSHWSTNASGQPTIRIGPNYNFGPDLAWVLNGGVTGVLNGDTRGVLSTNVWAQRSGANTSNAGAVNRNHAVLDLNTWSSVVAGSAVTWTRSGANTVNGVVVPQWTLTTSATGTSAVYGFSIADASNRSDLIGKYLMFGMWARVSTTTNLGAHVYVGTALEATGNATSTAWTWTSGLLKWPSSGVLNFGVAKTGTATAGTCDFAMPMLIEVGEDWRTIQGAIASAQYVWTGTAAPTTGTWNRGDIVWNTTPTASNPPGWVCVTAGSPGTWKAMANLAA